MTTSSIDEQLTALRSLLHPEIITPTPQTASPPYRRLVSTTSLSATIAYLHSTTLGFATYSHGFMSASAKDVLVNTSAFDDFHFNEESETVTIRAGRTWAEVHTKLEDTAQDTGSSSTMARASTEPELLWALRGGGAGYLYRFVVRPRDIWAGPILVPWECLEQVADGIERFVSGPVDPRITMFLYVVEKRLLESIGVASDMLVIHAFDAHGEAHGRASFQWALDVPGAVDQTGHIVKGRMKQFWAPLLREITKETTINAVRWYDYIQSTDESLSECTDPVGPVSSCAWRRPVGAGYILLLGTGVLGNHAELHYLPNGLEDFHDTHKVYWGPHFARLQRLKRQYDPLNRFKSAIA
ncbi:hypothetical protein BDV25DRAFT_127423 [Aspergillus avenaceus]|uniref:Berberine/berberine-like domain-containing protein n=1 Tax=Aspergillus avenaceus TaxID=36643 RepID=A0A5N6U3U4_ASPAV|nr:hypothetical protein BDV25DRAFT_127423 [Aspergillus avenaceus]